MNRDDGLNNLQPAKPEPTEALEENWILDWLDDPAAPTKTASSLPVTLTDDLVPLSEDGRYVPHHLDASDTAHWFSIVEAEGANPSGEPYQLRYFRAAHDYQGQIAHDSYPVMPLNRRDWSPSPLPMLEMMLEDGDLENAQQLAYGTAQLQGLPFPDPGELPALNPRVDYYFSVGAADEDFPTLQAVKTWMEGSERRSAVQTIATYGIFEEAEQDAHELNEMLQTRGLDATMDYATWMAESGSYLSDGRTGPRLFTEGPPDPFTTDHRTIHAENAFMREAGNTEMQPMNAVSDAPNAAVEQFHAHFANSIYQLLQPIDPSVNYSFEVMAADPWTEELIANKWWFDERGRITHDSLTLATYSTDWPEFEKDAEHERAMLDREALHRTYREEGLQAAMRQAEAIAIAQGELDPNRADGRLFHAGPTDGFTSSREAELSEIEAQRPALAVMDITNDDTTELPALSPEPGSWEELLLRANADEPEVERHYWQLRVHQALTQGGTPLGYALFCTEFPELPPNFDEYVEEYGMDDSIYPTQARTVEIADFKTETEAKAFSDEFRRYLIPGVIDGPELAPDVAKLEGLSGQWEEMDYSAIVDYMSGSHTITREPEQWCLHHPIEDRQLSDEMEDSLFDVDF